MYRTILLITALFSFVSNAAEPVAFEKIVLADKYYCDGINFGDINKDGKLDIVAGPFWYEGPEFKIKHEFYKAEEFETAPSPTNSLFTFIYDFNGDGWNDILVLGRVHIHEAFWYENPKGKDTQWEKHFVTHRVLGESPTFLDVDGDGKPELVGLWDEQFGFFRPDWQKPTEPWKFVPITPKSKYNQFYHGMGIGDVNGDKRLDLILNDGWYEQPAANANSSEWVLHPFKFAEKGGAQIFVADIAGHGKADVITSLDAHGWGLAWFEQITDGGKISFKEHKIMGDRSEEQTYGVAFTQPHALAIADIDGDGLTDIIVGKRLWAHGPKGDIEPNAPPVLYWFQQVRTPGQETKFVPHLIDDKSGVGVYVTAADVNGDGLVDVLTVSKLGTFVFLQKKK